MFVHPPCISLYYCENILSNVADINILGLCTKIEEDDSKMKKKTSDLLKRTSEQEHIVKITSEQETRVQI